MASPFVYAVAAILVHSSLCGVLTKGDWCTSNFMSGDNSNKPSSDKVGQNNGQVEGNQSSSNMGGGHWNSMCCNGCSSPMDSWGFNGCGWPPMCNGFGHMGPYGPMSGMFGCGGMYPGFGNMCQGFGNMCQGGQGKFRFNQGNMSHGQNNYNMCHGQGNMCHGYGPMFNGCPMNPFGNCMYNNMGWNHPMWYNNCGCMNGPWGNPYSFNNPYWGGGCMNGCNPMNSSGSNFGNNNNQQGHCDQNKSNQAGSFGGCMNNCKTMDNNQGSHMKCNHNSFPSNSNGFSSCKEKGVSNVVSLSAGPSRGTEYQFPSGLKSILLMNK